MQPWRFEFEYAWAWRELDFPLYGIDRLDVIKRRMGPKGRGGKVPGPLIRWLPAGLWTDLIHLGVIETGPDWTARIDTRAGRHSWHREIVETRLASAARTSSVERSGATRVVESARSVDVDGVETRFEGLAMGEVWTGAANLDEVSVSIVTVGLEGTRVAIARIDDPTPYLVKSAPS